MKKLTQARVDKAESEPKQYFIWDRDLKGFGLRVSPGGAKSYVIRYRMGGRGFPARRYTIGKHDSPWTTIAARSEAKRLLAEVELGRDPKEAEDERQAGQLNSRFEQFAEQFLELYGQREWAENNYKNQAGYLRNWKSLCLARSRWPPSSASTSLPCWTKFRRASRRCLATCLY